MTSTTRPQDNPLAPVSIMTGAFAVALALIPVVGFYLSWVPGVITVVFASVGIVRGRRLRLGLAHPVVGLVLGVLSFAITGFYLAVAVIIPVISDHARF